MKFFNLGLAEILLIVVLALIVLGPGNMVKTAREVGAFFRRITKSPYWQEVWATRRELNEIPKILAKEAKLDETFKDLDLETRRIRSSLTSSMVDLIKEVEEPVTNTGEGSEKEPADTPEIPNPPAES